MNPIGSTLQQRYQILDRLGHNGSVTTYLAIDLQVPGNLQLKCAIHRYELLDPTPDSAEWHRAISSAQHLYELSRRIDRLPTVYGYFEQDRAFYVVREYVGGTPLSLELAAAKPWTQSQVVMLIADLLEALHDLDGCEVTPAQISLDRILRRNLDRKLVPIELPIAIDTRNQTDSDFSPAQRNLQIVGEIAIAAATGITGEDLPLPIDRRTGWQQQAPQVNLPELIAIIDRLVTTSPADAYDSITAAWQAIVGVLPKFLIHQHSREDTRTEIARHVQLLVDRGTEFYEVGNAHQAIVAYDRALSLDPECVDAYCGRGNARRYLGDYSGSWEDFDTAASIDPEQGIAYIGRGLAIAFGERANSSPIADFERGQLLLANPSTAIAYVMRGTAHAQLNHSQEAIADYTTAIRLNPRLVIAYNNRGNLHQQLGDFDSALVDFSFVLEIDSQSAIAFNNRAIVYTQVGEFSKAVADYHQAIELQPNFVSVYNNLGNTYCQMGDYASALCQYSQAVDLEPNFAVAYSNRANIHRIQGDVAAALVDYDRAIDLDPKLVIAFYNRGICHRQMGNHQAAIDNYTQTLALDRQYFYAYYHRGNARQYLGDKHGAIADYTQTICFDPNHLHAYYNRALVRGEIGDVQGSLEDLERAIELHPEFTLAYYQRAQLLATNHEHQYAIADYQRSIALKPDYLDAYYHRGCSYQILGDLSLALADFNYTLDLDPNYAPAYFQRGKVSAQLGDLTGAVSDYHKAANLYLDRGDSKTYQQILQIIDAIAVRG